MFFFFGVGEHRSGYVAVKEASYSVYGKVNEKNNKKNETKHKKHKSSRCHLIILLIILTKQVKQDVIGMSQSSAITLQFFEDAIQMKTYQGTG